jgi:hypothetical protein
MKRFISTLAVLCAAFALAGPAQATVLRVVTVETSDVAAYSSDLAKIRALQQRLGSKATMRIWRARFAGPNSGMIVVALEYPDWPSFTADHVMQGSNAEYAALLKGLDTRRKIVSDSIYEEVK